MIRREFRACRRLRDQPRERAGQGNQRNRSVTHLKAFLPAVESHTIYSVIVRPETIPPLCHFTIIAFISFSFSFSFSFTGARSFPKGRKEGENRRFDQ
jgi:hypothetical protein